MLELRGTCTARMERRRLRGGRGAGEVLVARDGSSQHLDKSKAGLRRRLVDWDR